MMMVRKSKGLSERHMKILSLLEEYADKGYPPSIREIGEKTGISSTSVVNYYLDQLEKWGYIERDRRVSRGLRVVPEMLANLGMAVNDLLRIPLAGRIVASEPVPVPASDFSYYDAESSIEIARSLLPGRNTDGLYALEVQGDSMIDAMVNDGDIVIMRRVNSNAEARNGDMVAVWLPSRDETTLKYFYKEADGYRLQPANPTMKPIYINKNDGLEIRGKVVMVIRKVAKAM
ncbi:MAG: transcriptional repressor LexA [Anaerolineales bacterium]|nr:transcriptional repressor LexA [Anaerolineales bacterium]MCX7754416.1 transcriptional repressor LexA [Anaerolineales bacterium]MDW8276530.1 transcriptional repressor LexA [Anaerolineales bacterium]